MESVSITGDLDAHTTAEARNDGRWTTRLGSEISGFGGTHGGYLSALGLHGNRLHGSHARSGANAGKQPAQDRATRFSPRAGPRQYKCGVAPRV
jgi:hypothetical protein